MPEAFADVVDGCFDVLVDAAEFVAPCGFERPVNLMDGFIPLAMVAVNSVFETVFGCFEFRDGVFGMPIPFGPPGMFEVLQGFFEFARLGLGNAERECEGERQCKCERAEGRDRCATRGGLHSLWIRFSDGVAVAG